VCVIGAQVRRDLFGAGNPVNRRIHIDDRWFTVVGVMENKSVKTGKASAINVRDVNRDVYVPITSALKRFTDPDRPEGLDEIVVQVQDEARVLPTAGVLRRLM